MLLRLKNVGRLKPAEVNINGLTVICGNNNTGKSTIGKIIYCIFSAFYEIEKNIQKEKTDLIVNNIEKQMHIRGPRISKALAESINDLVEQKSASIKDIQATIEEFLKNSQIEYSRDSIQTIVKMIQKVLQVDQNEVVNTFLKRRINAEFDGQIGNVNHPKKKTGVDLTIRDQHIIFHASGTSENLIIDDYISLEKKIIYLDDPFILDHVNDLYFMLYDYANYGHSYQISSKIRNIKLHGYHRTAVEEVLRKNELNEIIEKINNISDGEVVAEDGKLVYRHAKLQKKLGMSSLSTGIKTFIILKELLLNGDLEENGIMIIDEPEVHLHPEWQIKFAEIIVMLQKAYGLNIVLTTHSMDFLCALVSYSKKYGIEDSCNYYLSQLEDEDDSEEFPLASLQLMNNNIQEMYASVSKPFEKLFQQMDIGDFLG